MEERYTCPQCGKPFPFIRYDVIDTGKRPDMKEKVRNGDAFYVSCPYCGWHTHFDYSFLYREEGTHTLIYYANSREFYEAAYYRMTGRNGGRDFESIRTWKRRVVTSRNDLLEKLLILDCGLDNRIIEIMKGLAFISLKQKYPAAEVDTVLFDRGGDGSCYFRFSKNETVKAAYAFEESLYGRIDKVLGPKIRELSQEDVVINSQWAAGIMKELESL